MSDRPWYKRFPADFVNGTLHMNLEQKGAYSVCIDLIFDRGGPIDDNPQWIARACGCSLRKWKLLREYLISQGNLTENNGTLCNKRAIAMLETSVKDARKLSENGMKGARKAAENRAVYNENNKLASKGHVKLNMHTRGQRLDSNKEVTSVTSKGADSGREKRDARGSRISDDWRVSGEGQSFASEKGFSAGQVIELAEQFLDHWKSVSGAKGIKRDWEATWRVWCRNDIKFNGHPISRVSVRRSQSRGSEPVSVVAVAREIIHEGAMEGQSGKTRIRY